MNVAAQNHAPGVHCACRDFSQRTGSRRAEARRQLYATNMNSNERGELVVGEVEDPEHLDQRRADVGLPPFRDPGMPRDQPLKNPEEFYRRYVEWLHRVGWR